MKKFFPFFFEACDFQADATISREAPKKSIEGASLDHHKKLHRFVFYKRCITFNKLFITKNYINEPHDQIFQWLDHCD